MKVHARRVFDVQVNMSSCSHRPTCDDSARTVKRLDGEQLERLLLESGCEYAGLIIDTRLEEKPRKRGGRR